MKNGLWPYTKPHDNVEIALGLNRTTFSIVVTHLPLLDRNRNCKVTSILGTWSMQVKIVKKDMKKTKRKQ